jgi:tetratricopeptide (TPR) repeat protein
MTLRPLWLILPALAISVPIVPVLKIRAQDPAVKVHEDKLTLATYNEGAPDTNPQFDFFYNNWFPNYPYTIRTPINKVRQMVPWRVVVIENEYLSCRVLPDLGGHLHGCTDKITGKEIFYANPAVRRTSESTRGEFIAMGIESSFPIAHSRVDSSPLDFAYSVSNGVGRVVVEDRDRTSGMTWRDEFMLRSGTAVLEQRVTLYNGSTVRRGYQWWANAAIELDDPHLRIVYPVKWMLPHGDGPMMAWPISDAGLDLSDVANHQDGIGLFGHGSHEPWMAIYKPKFRSGVAHYGDPDQLKGKKIWLWGTNDHYVQSNLTENFNSYIEMQAGEMETQPEFAFLRPEETKSFTHYWIPFHDLGGVSRVTRDAVLSLSRSGQNVQIEIDATHVMKGAKVRVSNGGAVIEETTANLDPKIKFARTLQTAAPKVTVDILDATGQAVLHHVEGEYDAIPFDKTAPNPEPVLPADKSDSEAAVLERGKYYEQRDMWSAAWHEYVTGIRKAPTSEKLRLATGRAAIALGRYSDAAKLLNGMNDPEAAWYLGVALRSTSPKLEDAAAAFVRAQSDPSWARAAGLQLAFTARGPEGLATIRALAAQSNTAPNNVPSRMGALEVAVLRRTGRTEDARQRLAYWLEQDPVNNMLRVERMLLGGAEDAALWNHLGADPERVLNLADDYREIGGWEDALRILSHPYAPVAETEKEPGSVLPQENPLVVYYRGYCRLKLGQEAAPDFRLASTLSTLYIFPHREIYFRILEAALLQNVGDPVAHALLGDLYFDSLQTDEAIAEWRKALALKRDLPAVHRNLGRALLEIKGDRAGAAAVLQEGKRIYPDDREITEILSKLNAR